MIKFIEDAHWYDKLGNPQHDSDLRGARKGLYYASPTSIDKDVFKNYGLERWKTDQLASVAFESPRQEHEDKETFVNRIYEMSLEKAKIAAEFGKKYHAMVENYPKPPEDTELLPWLDFYRQWHSENILEDIHAEKVLLDHQIGVAGTGDKKAIHRVHGRVWVDIKTQDVKKDAKGRKKPAIYDSWGRQLAFYSVTDAKAEGYFPDVDGCLSVVVDSNEPDAIYEKFWTKDEIAFHYRQFVIGAWRWFSSKGKDGYWPCGEWNVEIPSIQMLD